MRVHKVSSLLFLMVVVAALLVVPLIVRAASLNPLQSGILGFGIGAGASALLKGDFGMSADLMCTPDKDYTRPCGTPPDKTHPKPGGKGCPCKDAFQPVIGICVAEKVCKAQSYTGVGGTGGGAVGIDQVMKSLGELFGKLMQQPPPTTPPPTTAPGGGTGYPNYGCQGTRYSTHDISRISDPCADYTPEIVIDPDLDPETCPPLSQALGLCTTDGNNCPNVPEVNCTSGYHLVSGGQDSQGCVLRDTCEPDTSTTSPASTSTSTTIPRIIFATTTSFGGLSVPPVGARGDINMLINGATIVAGTRDTQNNVEVAGFYGSETFGGQGSQGLVGGWCKARPWANNFLSKIISPSFFDGLCSWRGFQVGTPPPPPTPVVVLQQTPKPKPAAATTTATAAPQVPPKVDIWAVPASVPLGARTSIFWNTQGVTNCTETSPNGGFNQNSLSGGAATQPITSATTFSISCLAPDGTPVTSSVTVNLKI